MIYGSPEQRACCRAVEQEAAQKNARDLFEFFQGDAEASLEKLTAILERDLVLCALSPPLCHRLGLARSRNVILFRLPGPSRNNYFWVARSLTTSEAGNCSDQCQQSLPLCALSPTLPPASSRKVCFIWVALSGSPGPRLPPRQVIV